MTRRFGVTAIAFGVVAALGACRDTVTPTCSSSWLQWGGTAEHDGAACAAGQTLGSALADVVYDPFIADEVKDARGELVIHYQTPLVDGDDVYMLVKTGTYTPCPVGSDGLPACGTVYTGGQVMVSDRLNTQIWTEQAFHWSTDGTLSPAWSYASDWKPEPGVGFEPMFQPALDGDVVVVPGAGGAVWEISRADGSVARHDQPFGSATDPDTYVAGGLAVADDGTIYYNALKIDHDNPFGQPVQGWLVAVSTDGRTQTATYSSLIVGAPAATDGCYYTYAASTAPPPLPWPPPAGPDGSAVLPPQYACGAQRPGINSTPAIAHDGTIYVVSRAHYDESYSYVAAVHPDLTPKWATSLRGLLSDGCGVTIPDDATATTNTGDCASGAPMGVDPLTGMMPAALVDDDSSAAPVAVSDGVLYGSFSGYNDSRGHLLKLDLDGHYVANFDFGWDDTPAIESLPSGYRVITKDNHYNFDGSGVDLGPYFITELDDDLSPVWKFQSTNTQSCTRQSDGSLQCTSDHPHGFEWCINAPAVDRDGTIYVNSEDGNAYAIAADGTLRETFFLNQALGAAYTPIALDASGRVFALNNGHLTAMGAAK